MGFKSIRVSDLSGKDLKDEEVVTVLIRDANKKLDASLEELSGLKRVNNVVELEYQKPDGSSETVLVAKAEYDKLFTDDVLSKADSIRGRRTGYRPGNGSNGAGSE